VIVFDGKCTGVEDDRPVIPKPAKTPNPVKLFTAKNATNKYYFLQSRFMAPWRVSGGTFFFIS